MSAYTNRTRTRGGLTVLEIIVILVVLVILAAVLLPVFARTGGGARKSTCQSNLKECAIALQTYWNDYDGHLPSSAVVRGSKKWNRRDFVEFASRPVAFPFESARQTGWAGVLYNYYKSKDIMFCPLDPTDRGDPNTQVSYYWKAAIDKAWYGVGCKKPCRRESDFGYNADQIVLYERAGFHCGAPEGLRNGVMVNVAYLDSHVRSIAITNSLPANGRQWVTSPTAPGEPAYFNFDNDRQRGKGNPPDPNVRTTYTDPNRYADILP